MNYCSFFGVYQERIKGKFKNISFARSDNIQLKNPTTTTTLEKKVDINPAYYENSRNIFKNLEDENNILSIYSIGKQSLMFQLRNNKKNQYSFHKNIKQSVVTTHIEKSVIVKNIDTINKTIEELGLDIEWYARSNCFKDRLLLIGTSYYMNVSYTYVPLASVAYYIVN